MATACIDNESMDNRWTAEELLSDETDEADDFASDATASLEERQPTTTTHDSIFLRLAKYAYALCVEFHYPPGSNTAAPIDSTSLLTVVQNLKASLDLFIVFDLK